MSRPRATTWFSFGAMRPVAKCPVRVGPVRRGCLAEEPVEGRTDHCQSGICRAGVVQFNDHVEVMDCRLERECREEVVDAQ